MSNDITTLLLVLAPASLMLGAVYLVLRRMLEADQHRRKAEILIGAKQETIRIRLHAIEQLTVFMEQLSPMELVTRTTRSAARAADLQLLLLDVVRNEMAQYMRYQLYVSMDTWKLIVNAHTTTNMLINQAAAAVRPEEPAINLSKNLIESLKDLDALPTAIAIEALRKEAQCLFA